MNRQLRVRSFAFIFMSFILVAVVAGFRAAASARDDQQDHLAESAKTVLRQRCFKCHGLDGVARKNLFVLDHASLINSRSVVPRDMTSPLLKLVESGAMPFGGQPLPDQEKRVLRDWIASGARAWENEGRATIRTNMLSESSVVALIRDDLLNAPERSRTFLRYFSFANLHNAGVPATDLEVYRVALSKLMNSLSWHPEISRPVPIDAARIVFRIDLRDYDWQASAWDLLLAAYPYGVQIPGGAGISQLTGAAMPYVRADWFVTNASLPPLYHELLGLPKTAFELERLLGIDATRHIREERNVVRAGLRSSGVSQNNRILERHVSIHGAYWKSYDFRSNVDDENIFKDPINFRPAGSEIIFNLPNGMQAYFLADSVGRRIDDAPVEIVADRSSPDDPVIHNGRSCMSCHFRGIQSFTDDLRPVLTRGSAGAFDRDRALALYVDQPLLDRLLERDRERFERAVDLAGGRSVDAAQFEPINALSRRFSAELNLVQASAEAGLTADEFQTRVQRSQRLAALGYGQLLVKGGGLRRDLWERNFGELIGELGWLHVPPRAIQLRRDPRFPGLSHAGVTGGSRSGSPGTRAISADPGSLMRTARAIFITSETVFLKPAQLEDELRKRPEFTELGLVIVKDAQAADMRVNLDRPLFTYTFTFTAINPDTSILLTSGKLTAFDGNFAAPKIAKELLKRLKAARPDSTTQSREPPKK